MNIAIDLAHFLAGPLRSVVLGLPKCEDVVVNPVHARDFNQDDEETRTSTSMEGLANLLRNPPKAAEDRICYCEKIKAVLALRSSECVFERAYQALKEDSTVWFSSPEFRWKSQNANKGNRRYIIDNMFARDAGDGYLEVRHAGLTGLDVVVASNPVGEVPKALTAMIYLNDGPWIPSIEGLVTPDATYAPFFTLISTAAKDVNSSIETRAIE